MTEDRAPTLGRIYLHAMRHHDRAAALLHPSGERWRELPDWHLDRLVLRVGLYLRDRARLGAGETVAIVAPLRPEALLVEWAAVVQGAASAWLDAALADDALASVLRRLAPRVLVLANGDLVDRLGAPEDTAPGHVLTIDDPGPSDAATFSEALELGGTLDTPERANQLRERAREVRPDQVALWAHAVRGSRVAEVVPLTHAAAVERLHGIWSSDAAASGDRAYLGGGEATLTARLAALAFMGDGKTTTVIGTPGRELAELVSLRPRHVVTPAPLLEAIAPARPARRARRVRLRSTTIGDAARARVLGIEPPFQADAG